jgi:hypothetical protein
MKIVNQLKQKRINCGIRKTQFIYLRKQNSFKKYSVQIKFYKDSQDDMDTLERIKTEYFEDTNSEIKIKDSNKFYVLEVSNKFKRFAVMDTVGTILNDIPAMGTDTELEIFFEIYKTASGFNMPMLMLVVVHDIATYDTEKNQEVYIPPELQERFKKAKIDSDIIKEENQSKIDKELDELFTTKPKFPKEPTLPKEEKKVIYFSEKDKINALKKFG